MLAAPFTVPYPSGDTPIAKKLYEKTRMMFLASTRGGGANRGLDERGQFAAVSSSLAFFAARSLRSDARLSSRRWELWTTRSSTASAMWDWTRGRGGVIGVIIVDLNFGG